MQNNENQNQTEDRHIKQKTKTKNQNSLQSDDGVVIFVKCSHLSFM